MALQIKIPKRINDSKIGDAFNYLFLIIEEMEKSDEENIVWDFSSTVFLTPFFLLPLMLYKERCGKNVIFSNLSTEIELYFNVIHFNGGINPEKMDRKEFEKYIGSFSSKRYIPIINFPAMTRNEDIKSSILSIIGNILEKQLNLSSKIRIALSYLIDESVNNITDHSKSEKGYIFAQYYPKKGYIDICIADNGITILGSYIENKNQEIKNDVEAIQAACKGVSTKNLPDAENRGYGIITSKKMLTQGLEGIYFLFSGGAFNIKTKNEDNYVNLPDYIRWNGTIVALRVPYSINESFNYIKYVS